ncbi:MAG TPA: AAA family ATPase [Opitutaceae bacterium]|nr:AAA family ATPase [Opitutaceae bacterium]
MIASIDFTNFKVLRSARIELGPFNLIIGPNGSGKTSALLALQRLRQFAARPVVFGTAPAGRAVGETGLLHFRFTPPFHDIEALLECAPDGSGRALRVDGPGELPVRWAQLVARLTSLRVISLDQAALARPSPAGAPIMLGDDGTNLPAALHRLEREEPETFARVQAEFRRILPEYRSIGVVVASDGTRRLAAEIEGESRQLGAEDLSQGTLVLLGLLVLTQARPLPAILCLEEIDRGMHPRLLREIRDLLYRMSYPPVGAAVTQILATTHSPYLLDLFREQLEEVIITQKRGAEATFERLSDREDLRGAIGNASLGDLWYSGILGGVPDEF